VNERRTKSLTNLSVATALKVGEEPLDFHQGETWPDPFLNLRLDQDWGYAAVTGGLHNLNATYYTGNNAAFGFAGCAQASTTICGHPSDKVGWFVQGGFDVKTPFGPGDHFGAAAKYSVGASGFGSGQLSSPDLRCRQQCCGRLDVGRRLCQRLRHRAHDCLVGSGRLRACLVAGMEQRDRRRLWPGRI
jgi:hypothetical protein